VHTDFGPHHFLCENRRCRKYGTILLTSFDEENKVLLTPEVMAQLKSAQEFAINANQSCLQLAKKFDSYKWTILIKLMMILCFYEYCDISDLSQIDKWRRSGQIRFSFFWG
jgi:hypothetical protein